MLKMFKKLKTKARTKKQGSFREIEVKVYDHKDKTEIQITKSSMDYLFYLRAEEELQDIERDEYHKTTCFPKTQYEAVLKLLETFLAGRNLRYKLVPSKRETAEEKAKKFKKKMLMPSKLEIKKKAIEGSEFSLEAKTIDFDPEHEKEFIYSLLSKDKNRLDNKLYSFQKEGVEFGLSKNGRFILGDEMGVGKTVQALAISIVYKKDLPCLVLCPSSLRFNWRDEIIAWVSKTEGFSVKNHIQLISRGDQSISKKARYVIISYDLAKNHPKKLSKSKFGMVIADEAHLLKNPKTVRAKTLNPIISSIKRIMLLTGTPALSSSKELFSLLHVLRPDKFDSYKQFRTMYCDRTREHEARLNLLLAEFMLRRLKKDVLEQLPSKVRLKVRVETDQKVIGMIVDLRNELAEMGVDLDKELKRIMEGTKKDKKKKKKGQKKKKKGTENEEKKEGKGLTKEQRGRIRGNIFKIYQLSGVAKIASACSFLNNCLSYKDQKFVLFAHHRAVIEGLTTYMKQSHPDVGFVTITGGDSMKAREEGVKKFQKELSDEEKETGGGVRVAILSIRAASMGFTLTAASTVIFVELYWTPALIVQAEDRLHRISQKNSVTVYYLMGQATIDLEMFRLLVRKFDSVSRVLDGDNAQVYEAEDGDGIEEAIEEENLIENQVAEENEENIEDPEIQKTDGKDDKSVQIQEVGSNDNEDDQQNVKKTKKSTHKITDFFQGGKKNEKCLKGSIETKDSSEKVDRSPQKTDSRSFSSKPWLKRSSLFSGSPTSPVIVKRFKKFKPNPQNSP